MKEVFVDNGDGRCSYGVLDGICFNTVLKMGLGVDGHSATLHSSSVRRRRKKDRERKQKEIPVFEHNLFMTMSSSLHGAFH